MRMPSDAGRRAAFLLAPLAVLHSALPVAAQTGATRPEFEVASIKAEPDTVVRLANGGLFFPGKRVTWSGGTLTLAHFSVKDLILDAYDLHDEQLAGAGLTDSPRYRIVAKAPPHISESEARAMTQALLVERFGLQFHRETRELKAYALAPAKGGTKLTKAKDRPDRNEAMHVSLARGHISQTLTMAELAALLTKQLGRHVSDMTGVRGEFAIDLQWTPGDDEPNFLAGLPEKPHTAEAPARVTDFPPIFTAIQEQLGLRLEVQRNVPVEVMVVDSVRKPGED